MKAPWGPVSFVDCELFGQRLYSVMVCDQAWVTLAGAQQTL